VIGHSGKRDPAPTGTRWSDSSSHAAIKNEDLSAMPPNAAFSLIISYPDPDHCTGNPPGRPSGRPCPN
jgi:hypothetical protein